MAPFARGACVDTERNSTYGLSMQNWDEYIDYYLMQLATGMAPEDAFFSLIEIPSRHVCRLVEAFKQNANWRIDSRKHLLEIIIEHRSFEVIPLLQELLFAKEPELWKVALDGLARIGSEDVISFLSRAEAEIRRGDTERSSWVAEVVQDLVSPGKHIGPPGDDA